MEKILNAALEGEMDAHMDYEERSLGNPVTVTRAFYNVLGVDRNGYKDLPGIYISKSEGANFGLSVITDLQSRGVKDILTGCTNNFRR